MYRFLALTLLSLVIAALGTGCITVDMGSLLEPEMQEHELDPGTGRSPAKIAVVDLAGVIANAPSSMLSPTRTVTPQQVTAALRRAELDDSVKAVVLRIDTPGGAAAASDVINHEIQAFRERTGKPVYASIMGLGCSGGYYAAVACDRIYAQPTTVTGSIGVIARFPRLAGLAGKVGYDEVILKSGPMKDMAHPLLDIDPQQREVLQTMVDTLYEQFLLAVIAGRDRYSTPEQLRPVADGRIYTAPQALELGLIDEIGYLDEAIAAAKTATGSPHAAVVAYRYGRGTDATIYDSAAPPALPGQGPLVNVDLGTLFGHGDPGFYFLWQPGQ